MTGKTKSLIGVLIVVVAGIAVWQFMAPKEQLPAAKIGALLPLTGSLAAFGGSTLSGIELGVMEVNEAGGVLGGRLELVTADTQTNPQAAVLAAQILTDVENVSGIVGAMASGVTIPVALSVASMAGVAMLSPSATSPVITDLDDKDFLFRTTPHDAVQGVLLAKLVTAKGIDTVALLYRNDDYGKGLAKAFAENFSGGITSIVGYEPDQPAYDLELAQVAGGGTDTLVLVSFPEEGIPILRQAIGDGFFSNFIFTDGMKVNDVVVEIGQEFLETSFGTAPQATATAALTLYKNHYEANIGEIPRDRPFVENAYDATILLALAIEKAGSPDPKAVRDALRAVANPPGEIVRPSEFAKGKALIAEGADINYEGAAGSQDLDDAGDVNGTFAHWAFRDGEVVVVEKLTE